MSYNWSTHFEGYRARIKTDFSSEAIVYLSNMSMAQSIPLASIRQGCVDWGDATSGNVIVIREKGRCLLAGAVTAFRSLSVFRVVYDNCRIIAIEVWQPDIREGEAAEETVILEGVDWRKLLFQYAEIAARKMGVPPVVADRNVTGYCSWYYYYDQVTEENMLENVEALASNRSPYAAEYVQIDDGYQTFQGDWLDQHESWPLPIHEVARKILNSGMKAGIWTMPTTASTASRVFREHPGWFVKNDAGEPVTLAGWSPEPNHRWACLDATLPEVREHIAGVFQTFRSWGFTYFKMDGLNFGLQRGYRHDPDATAVSAFRLLLKTIREAVPDCILLGCTAPLLPCLGLVDICRVSNDTSRYFYPQNEVRNTPGYCGVSIVDAFHISLANFWTFDRWFRADPDVVMARQDNAFYTRNQAKISVLAAIMTGISLTSDHLGTIQADRNALLAKAQNIRMRDVMPVLDSKPNVWPVVFEGTVNGKRAVAVINDIPACRTWTMEELRMPDSCLELLEDKKIFREIRFNGEDAALLVAP